MERINSVDAIFCLTHDFHVLMMTLIFLFTEPISAQEPLDIAIHPGREVISY